MIRFHFEDNGQDCLWLDVEDLGNGIGKVVDAGPLQSWIWANGKHHVNLMEPHGIGDHLWATNDLERSLQDGYAVKWKYPITRIEEVRAAA